MKMEITNLSMPQGTFLTDKGEVRRVKQGDIVEVVSWNPAGGCVLADWTRLHCVYLKEVGKEWSLDLYKKTQAELEEGMAQ